MKKCPTCNRTYADETLTFCLADGSLLSAPYDHEATQSLPDANSMTAAVPLSAPQTSPTVPQASATNYEIKQDPVRQWQPVSGTKRGLWIVSGIIAALVIGIIIAVAAFYYRTITLTNNNRDTGNANTVAANNSNSKQENLLPQPSGYANDFASVIDAKSKNQLEKVLGDLKKRKDIEFVVATIKTTGGRPIANYTMTVANQWGIKGASGGILLLVAVDDRQYQFSTSRQLEDKLSHDLLAQYGRLMTPLFKQEKYGEGILKGVNAVIAKLDEQDSSK
jgi:uncharacterized protein